MEWNIIGMIWNFTKGHSNPIENGPGTPGLACVASVSSGREANVSFSSSPLPPTIFFFFFFFFAFTLMSRGRKRSSLLDRWKRLLRKLLQGYYMNGMGLLHTIPLIDTMGNIWLYEIRSSPLS